MAAPIAVVVQCFVKLDTLRDVLESICNCEGANHVDLIIWHEGLIGTRREAEFTEPWQNVCEFLILFSSSHKDQFRSIENYENSLNLGPYKTCQHAMNYAFQKHEFVIFTEDDVIFSRDALLWFAEIRDAGLLEQEQIWAIAAESTFFDAREKSIEQSFIEQALTAAREQQLLNKYVTHKFVPSSCFATSRQRWSEFGETRGRTNGDVEVCHRCAAEDRRCVFPIIARGRDVGMLHDLGYSVTIHTKVGVLSAAKNTYVSADDLLADGPIGKLGLELFDGDAGALFGQSTRLEGFAPRYAHRAETLGISDSSEPSETAAADAFQTQRSSENLEALISLAKNAFDRRDLEEALQYWDTVARLFPGEVAGLIGEADTLRDLARLDEAEAVLLEAMTLFANSEWAAARYAAIAALKGDWSEALLRWDAVRDRFPDRPVGYMGRGEVLREMGRYDEADEAFAEAIEQFPENEWASTHYAETAARQRDWGEALRRWEFVTAKFPDHADGYVGLAGTLRGLGRFDEADALLAQAVVRFTRNHWVAIGYAQTAMERRDWAKAARRWDLVLQRFPREPTGHIGKAAALVEAGQLDAAAAILTAAASLFPKDPRFTQWTGG